MKKINSATDSKYLIRMMRNKILMMSSAKLKSEELTSLFILKIFVLSLSTIRTGDPNGTISFTSLIS